MMSEMKHKGKDFSTSINNVIIQKTNTMEECQLENIKVLNPSPAQTVHNNTKNNLLKQH